MPLLQDTAGHSGRGEAKHPHVASRRPYARIHIGFTLAPSDRYQAGTTFGTRPVSGGFQEGEN